MTTITPATKNSKITPTTPEKIQEIIYKQRAFFKTGATLPQGFREQQLKALRKAIQTYEGKINQALKSDLNKSPTETYASELVLVYEEIDYMLKNLGQLMKPEPVDTPATSFPAKSFIMQEPFGMVLDISPWNYPFQLSVAPLVGAIAAGNTVVLKPSEYSVHTSLVLAEMLNAYFDESYIAVVQGDADVNKLLLKHKFDYIFFTGSVPVGKIVMKAASEHLTPVTLELGGKSPCIVDKTADLALAAKRIMWGKTLNSGQTCIAPDYLLVHHSVKDKLVAQMKRAIKSMYGADPLKSPDYPKMISEHHFQRVKKFLVDGKAVIGGKFNDNTHQITPTVLDGVTWNSPVMQEEIFGPVFPMLTFDNIDEVIHEITAREKPLSLYLFSKDSKVEEKILQKVSFGGGCINDTLVHITNNNLPFGGVGHSGMGGYHGKFSFYTFSHKKGIVKRGTWLDMPLRYPPYTQRKLSLIKKLSK